MCICHFDGHYFRCTHRGRSRGPGQPCGLCHLPFSLSLATTLRKEGKLRQALFSSCLFLSFSCLPLLVLPSPSGKWSRSKGLLHRGSGWADFGTVLGKLASWSLSFLITKVRVVVPACWRTVKRTQWNNAEKAFPTCLARSKHSVNVGH